MARETSFYIVKKCKRENKVHHTKYNINTTMEKYSKYFMVLYPEHEIFNLKIWRY